MEILNKLIAAADKNENYDLLDKLNKLKRECEEIETKNYINLIEYQNSRLKTIHKEVFEK